MQDDFNAAINFALDEAGSEGLTFLNLWREGCFPEIREQFPEFKGPFPELQIDNAAILQEFTEAPWETDRFPLDRCGPALTGDDTEDFETNGEAFICLIYDTDTKNIRTDRMWPYTYIETDDNIKYGWSDGFSNFLSHCTNGIENDCDEIVIAWYTEE